MKYGVFGNYGHSNIGDEAILRGLLALLENKDVNVFTDSLTASSLIHSKNNSKFLTLKPPLRGRIYMIPSILLSLIRSILRNDIVIIGGGGLFNDVNKTAFFQYVFLLLASRLLFKKVYIVGVSVGPLNSLPLKLVLKMSSMLANKIYVRDADSVKYFRSLNTNLIPDLSLGSDFLLSSKGEVSANRSNYIVSISLMDVTKTHTADIQSNYIHQIQQFIKQLKCIEDKLKIELIAMDFEKDLGILEPLKNVCQDYDIECEIIKVDDFTKLDSAFSKSNFIIATRLHSAILSILYEKPFLAISYQQKVKNYFDSHGLSEPIIDILELEDNELFSKYKEMLLFFNEDNRLSSLKQAAKLKLNNVVKELI